MFVAPYAGAGKLTFNVIEDDAVVARYRQTRSRLGLNVGVNLGAQSDVRIGAYVGQTSAAIKVGDPGLPELRGRETGAELLWRLDTQDSPVVPSTGVLSQIRLSRVFDGPDLAIQEQPVEYAASLTQLSAGANGFWSAGPRNRLFLAGSLGTSFEGHPLPTSEFELGGPFRLGAFDPGEVRGNHLYTVSGGYLRQIARLPDFMGGPVFLGGWLENGDAFDDWSKATWRTHGSVGLAMDTLVGPVLLAGSWSFDGRWRIYLGIGRLFR